ncbi:hypothetical protein AVEN_111140-1 [Araneus ventricosus]|uniref:Uncharacterized protein n=1 Tax=Araneus ventricosus TaxID=182803 RepID=A0A4Y2C8C5_ARAVE|nr:hypothetical protein AVEN_111140-1 [Araneus ventricosus]
MLSLHQNDLHCLSVCVKKITKSSRAGWSGFAAVFTTNMHICIACPSCPCACEEDNLKAQRAGWMDFSMLSLHQNSTSALSVRVHVDNITYWVMMTYFEQRSRAKIRLFLLLHF